MKIINLREYYQEIFKEDRFIEVTDEVAALFADDKRQQKNYSQYIRDNKAIYSLDCGDGIEKDSLYPPEKPDEVYEHAELVKLLDLALSSLPKVQARRIYKHIILRQNKTQIARDENVSEGAVRNSISQGLKKLKDFLKSFEF